MMHSEMQSLERKRNFIWIFKPLVFIENLLGCASMNNNGGEILEATTFQTYAAKLLVVITFIPMVFILSLNVTSFFTRRITVAALSTIMHVLQTFIVTHIYVHVIIHKSAFNKLYKLLYTIDEDLGIFDRTEYMKLFVVNCLLIFFLFVIMLMFGEVAIRFHGTWLSVPSLYVPIMAGVVSVMRLVCCTHFLTLRSEEVCRRLQNLCEDGNDNEDLERLFSAFSKICDAVQHMELLFGSTVFYNICMDFVGGLLNNLIYFQISLVNSKSPFKTFLNYITLTARHSAQAALSCVALEMFFDVMKKCQTLSSDILQKYGKGPERQLAKKIRRSLAVQCRTFCAGGFISLHLNFLVRFMFSCLIYSITFTVYNSDSDPQG